MHRNLDQLQHGQFDVLIIGGGLHGAIAAWDASLRGLRTALVERDDFCSGTTGNSLRVVHGGLRALQQGDLVRLRESAREQATLLRIASNYLQPLPCLIPFQRGDQIGAAAFHAAFSVMRMATADIARPLGASLPKGRVLSRAETLAQFDGFDSKELTGGALWYDAQVPELERLVLAFVTGAARRGAVVANHVKVERILGNHSHVVGAEVTDQLSGRGFQMNARSIINAAGPWADHLPPVAPSGDAVPTRYARAINIVVNQRAASVAFGVRSPWGAERDPVSGGRRFLFVTPWQGASLAGTSYVPLSDKRPELPLRVQVERLLQEMNDACPALRWNQADLVQVHSGRLPLGPGGSLIDRGRIVNHGTTGHHGLITIVAAKFTTARLMAQQAVDAVLADRGEARPCQTATIPLETDTLRPFDMAGRIRYAVEEEMAMTLDDVLTRRLGLTLARCPRPSVVQQVATTMGELLGWSPSRAGSEVRQVLGHFATPVHPRAA
jgi:glycerol-3-phosphate dehydrogenase